MTNLEKLLENKTKELAEVKIKTQNIIKNYKKLLELYRDVKTYSDNINDRYIINDVGESIKEDLYELENDGFFIETNKSLD